MRREGSFRRRPPRLRRRRSAGQRQGTQVWRREYPEYQAMRETIVWSQSGEPCLRPFWVSRMVVILG